MSIHLRQVVFELADFCLESKLWNAESKLKRSYRKNGNSSILTICCVGPFHCIRLSVGRSVFSVDGTRPPSPWAARWAASALEHWRYWPTTSSQDNFVEEMWSFTQQSCSRRLIMFRENGCERKSWIWIEFDFLRATRHRLEPQPLSSTPYWGQFENTAQKYRVLVKSGKLRI